MSTIDTCEVVVRTAGVAVLGVAWFAAAAGAADGRIRKRGRTTGLARYWPAPTVYLLGAVPYFALCIVLWRPLPIQLPVGARAICLVAGAVLGGGGAALYLGGRRSLGALYNVSSSLGSELYADHELVSTGPYAYVRHPMYAGLALSAAGGLLVYRTWTLVFMVAALAGAAFKAHREEQLLEAEFGAAWTAYCERVPAWIPRLRHPVEETKEVADDGFTTSRA